MILHFGYGGGLGNQLFVLAYIKAVRQSSEWVLCTWARIRASKRLTGAALHQSRKPACHISGQEAASTPCRGLDSAAESIFVPHGDAGRTR